MKKRLTIASSLVQAELLEGQGDTGKVALSCLQTGRTEEFAASVHQQNYYANELNCLFLHHPGATLTDVSNFLKQDLAVAA